ncbi:hypothetical protein [Micromonospora mirobrigensis]|uniref:Uncharacterized protein n=1 Tax=Micromonospora mirobrigensis TaxID=262898 RepID=A0A1C4YPL9_9ACTN|nr:hypothetical protein [Micromonospora mirobrigensis]SCF22600.1 hypothetical protein GA0070564_104261 [Micromonospora mirobrigensis]
MGHLTREQILARKTGRGTATLPDGSTVAIRALTRDEVLQAQESGRSTAERDTFIVATGMTDPKLSEEDVAAWAGSGDAGDLVAVSDAIAELSGLKPGAGKDATKSPAGRR